MSKTASSTDYLLFSSSAKYTNWSYGEKGLKLFTARRKGFNVPDAVLLSVEFLSRVIRTLNISREVLKINELENKGQKGLDSYAYSILSACKIDQEIDNELKGLVSSLYNFNKDMLFAVRSSAIGEDNVQNSFAGQYETILNVSLENIWKAIFHCYSSWWSDRIVAYRIQKNVRHSEPQISIIIQTLINPDYAGVLFTRDPLGRTNNIILEAVKGIGEQLVSGSVVPARWEADYQSSSIVSMPEPSHEAASLSEGKVKEIINNGKKLEKLFSKGLDIEWAVKDDVFYLLQVRPITSFQSNQDYINLTHNYYCRTIVEDLWSDRMTNITSSMIFEEFSDLYTFKIPLRKLKLKKLSKLDSIRVINGFGYLNAETVSSLLELLPDFLRFRELKNSFPEEIREQVLKIRPNYLTILKMIPRVPLLLDDLAIFPFLTTPLLRKHVRKISNQLLLHENYKGKKIPFLREELERLLSLLKKLQIRNQWGYGNASVTTWLSFHFATKFFHQDEKWILNKLTNIPDNVTLRNQEQLFDIVKQCDEEIVRNVFQLKDKEMAWKVLNEKYTSHRITPMIYELIKNYRFRSSNRDFINPRLDEKPSQVIEQISSLLQSDILDKNKQHKSKGSSGFHDKLTEIILYPIIVLAKKLLALREDLRFGLDVSFYKLRQILIAIQNSEELSIYNLNDDWIFFLNLNELREVLINPESLTGYLQTLNDRITLYNDEKDKSPAYYLKIDGENIIDLDKKSDNMHSFHGIAASPGIIEGKVKIIRGESDFSKLNKGEVLIAYNTDPGWTPLFLLAKGVVVEMGGLLNHCAIVAREYGIPAVVGVKHITQLLTDGQLVRINGHTGNVEVLSEN